jgi:hypothetical protein
MPVKRLSLSLLLAFFLLFAQQGVTRHAISHLGETPYPSSQEKQLPHQTACDLCGAYASLSSAATSSGFLLPATWIDLPENSASIDFVSSSTPQSYLARAPPSFV